ncbi:hypothetical protein [Allobaculum sp. Allo2]|uniref:DarT1-associated NADAR antitoxin family protein n=1 Tax=Allobaculum sp. Allo2 TaxID=2853432 RepID=UPI001F60AD6D|nr:hypothetical protein [Allobaculum sp. Allo2]UNT93060.1 hypothetical protein KWG61_13645 [Allobaculum sp. Allo2]
MTTRPVYTPKLTRPFYQQEDVEFDWHSGTSPAQKQKNSALLQETWKKKHPGKTILEVSTKSTEEMGRRLSPFNMTLRLPSLRKAFPVENVYQASKAFRHGGPYVDLLGVTPWKPSAIRACAIPASWCSLNWKRRNIRQSPFFCFITGYI